MISSGGVVILPTETISGLVGDVSTAQGLARILRIKRRPPHKPISVFINWEIMGRLFPEGIPDAYRRLADRFWPGPLTLVVPYRKERYQHLACGKGKVGLRFSSCKLIEEVLARVKSPLSATSANLSGEKIADSFEKILETFGPEVDLIVKAEGDTEENASTVLEMEAGRVRIIREGVLPIKEIRDFLDSE